MVSYNDLLIHSWYKDPATNEPNPHGFAVDLEKTRVERVNDKEYGLFAVKLIEKNDFIAELRGVVVHNSTTVHITKGKYVHNFRHVDQKLYTRQRSSAARIIRESDHPNTLAMEYVHEKTFHFVYIAACDIKPGTEITRAPAVAFPVAAATQVCVYESIVTKGHIRMVQLRITELIFKYY